MKGEHSVEQVGPRVKNVGSCLILKLELCIGEHSKFLPGECEQVHLVVACAIVLPPDQLEPDFNVEEDSGDSLDGPSMMNFRPRRTLR